MHWSNKLNLQKVNGESHGWGTNKKEQKPQIGDEAKIKNAPRLDQEQEGTMTRINKDTDRVTAKGKRFGQKVVRASKDTQQINGFSKEQEI